MRGRATSFSVLLATSLVAQQFPASPPHPKQSPWQAFHELSRQIGQAAPENRIKLDAFIAWKGDDVILRMRLTNVSSKPVRFYRFALPWGNSNALMVAALTTLGEPLEVLYPIDDPPPPRPDEPLQLAPGQTFAGDFSLGAKVRDISKTLQKSDIVVLWAYSLDRRTGGYVSGIAIGRRRGGA